jgi:glycosyltransferase involved in cell wall biosynthesis
MKLVFLISSLRAGGAERVASLLLNDWADKIDQIVLITFDTAENDFFVIDSRIKRYSLKIYKTSFSFFIKVIQHGWRAIKTLGIIYKEKPDIILSFLLDVNLLAGLLKFFVKTPVILSERTYVPYYIKTRILKKILPFLYKKADVYIAQTQQGAQWAEGFLPKEKIIIIPNPVIVPPIMENKEERRPIILAVGRLERDKGFDLLIKAAHRCLETHKEWQLWIVGEGKERPALEELIHCYKMQDRIFLKGKHQDVSPFYKQASVFVLSSRVEGFPNALLEAMSCGVAVVSADCLTGPRDIIQHNYNGLLIPPEDSAALEKALSCLIKDKELRLKLGENAQQVRINYSLDKISQTWRDVFQKHIKLRH